MPTTAFDFTLRQADGSPLPLLRHAGQVLLIVNTATACGFTPQLAGLQALHERYAQQGLVILGVPCNQFGAQAPQGAAAIAQFCEARYATGFASLDKVNVNPPQADPLFAWLKARAPGLLGGRIQWNFTKFLVGRDGLTVQRFAPMTKPGRLVRAIEAALATSAT